MCIWNYPNQHLIYVNLELRPVKPLRLVDLDGPRNSIWLVEPSSKSLVPKVAEWKTIYKRRGFQFGIFGGNIPLGSLIYEINSFQLFFYFGILYFFIAFLMP